MRQQIWQAALAALFVLAVGVVASTFLSRRVTKPVSAIARAASAVQTGEYKSARLSQVLARHDELGKLGKVFDQMAREVMAREQRMHMLRKVIPIGVSLSAEKDFNRLLETIVVESQNITHADGGTLYLLEGKQLRFFILRNTSLNLAIGGTTGAPIPFAPLELYDESGQPNHHHVATHVALSRQRINIPDAYETEEFDFSGTKTYDSTTGYRSKSFLTIPIEDEAGEIIGVLQLINSLDPETGEVVAFISDEVLETLVLLATTALNAYLRQEALRKEIERLNIAIDEKQRSRQVDEITDTDYFRSLLSSVKKFRKTDESGEQDEGSEE
jgi:HAMP domain-containing protein